MKKKLWLSILIITVVCALFLTACDRDDVKDVIDHVTATKTLSVPSGLRIENNYLKWNPVEYASRYIVSINGNENYCDDYQYGISSLRDGAYTFMVKACGDDVIYKSSEYSAKLTVELVDGASASNGYYSQFDDLTKNESFLGYGFDVINSSLFNDQVVKTSFPIFNQEKLMQQRLLKVDSKKSTVEEIASSDMESFMQDWNASLNVNVSWGLKKIGGSVGVEAKYSGGSSTAKSKYYHAINIKNQKFYIVMQSDMDTYKSIVSDGFKNDLMSNMEPAELFNKYGTHFITSAVMGGQITSYYLYTSESETSFHDVSAKVSVEVRYLVGKTNVDVGGGYRQFAESNNVFIKNTLDVLGGTDLGMLSDADIGKNYLNWEKSLDDHASLIGIKDTGSLVPIWDLIDDADDKNASYSWTDINGNTQYGTRRQQLEGYFMSYGVENYNSLLKNTGLPEFKAPTDITNVRVNEKTAEEGEVFEVYTGINNSIDFNVEPFDATGYTKSAFISTTTNYAEISTKDGIQLYISPDMPNNTTFDVILSAGNVRKTIKVRVVKRYMVNFVTNCEQQLKPYTNLVYGQQIDEPAVLTKEGYMFLGWHTDPAYKEGTKYNFGEEPILKDITLYARWGKNNINDGYQIVFEPKNGNDAEIKTIHYGDPLPTITIPQKDGYEFLGYFYNDIPYYNGAGKRVEEKYLLEESITLIAKWQATTTTTVFTIEYDDGNGNDHAPIQISYGDELPPVSVPSKKGYTFAGYYYNDKMYYNKDGMRCIDKFTLQENITLTAKWEVISLSIEMQVVSVDDLPKGDLSSVGNYVTANNGTYGSVYVEYTIIGCDSWEDYTLRFSQTYGCATKNYNDVDGYQANGIDTWQSRRWDNKIRWAFAKNKDNTGWCNFILTITNIHNGQMACYTLWYQTTDSKNNPVTTDGGQPEENHAWTPTYGPEQIMIELKKITGNLAAVKSNENVSVKFAVYGCSSSDDYTVEFAQNIGYSDPIEYGQSIYPRGLAEVSRQNTVDNTFDINLRKSGENDTGWCNLIIRATHKKSNTVSCFTLWYKTTNGGNGETTYRGDQPEKNHMWLSNVPNQISIELKKIQGDLGRVAGVGSIYLQFEIYGCSSRDDYIVEVAQDYGYQKPYTTELWARGVSGFEGSNSKGSTLEIGFSKNENNTGWLNYKIRITNKKNGSQAFYVFWYKTT